MLESCLEEAVRLSDLIGDLLFLARAESPLSAPASRTQSMSPNCWMACVSTTKLRQRRRYLAHDQLSNRTPVIAELDRTLVQRAVSNLVSNAVAHTPPGGAIMLVRRWNRRGSIRRFASKSRDTGVGIPPEALPKVFDRFFRLDSSRSQASGGTGLGLAIVQSIMLLHGGKVEIASQLGQGTRVTLHMPIAEQGHASAVPNHHMTKT